MEMCFLILNTTALAAVLLCLADFIGLGSSGERRLCLGVSLVSYAWSFLRLAFSSRALRHSARAAMLRYNGAWRRSIAREDMTGCEATDFSAPSTSMRCAETRARCEKVARQK